MLRLLPAVVLTTMLLAPAAGAQTAAFTLTSTDVHAGQQIAAAQVYKGMGCSGGNISPELQWKGAPAKAKSLALTVYDPDAPSGSGWWHWVVYNIPATASRFAAGSVPAGAVQGNTDFGTPGYGGPCPPAGDKAHHYIFTLYALDVDKLDVPAGASAAMVGFNLHAHAIGKATLTAVYSH